MPTRTAVPTVEKLLAQARRLDPPDRLRLLALLRCELAAADPSRPWDDWDDPEIDAAYADVEA